MAWKKDSTLTEQTHHKILKQDVSPLLIFMQNNTSNNDKSTTRCAPCSGGDRINLN